MRSILLLAVAVATALGTVGCQASGVDKAGAQTTVLRLATVDPINDNGQSFAPQAFIDNLKAVSGGKLKVQVSTDYGQGNVKAESSLVKAIAAGDVDGGWPSTRSFAAAGIPGLSAVEAPMTITSYAAERALVSGPVAKKLLATLDGSGVVGLGLTVGALRRPFAAKAALLGVEDWQGVRFRYFDSPVQSEAITALGATPVNASLDWVDLVLAGKLRGAEFDVAQYSESGLRLEAGNVTSNVVLWPKMFVLSLSRKRFDSLTKQQQGWVREAAGKAVRASVDATYDENGLAKQLCAGGVHFRPATPAQLAGLRTALQPVVARLAADPTDGPLLRQILAIAAQHPQQEISVGAGSCRNGVTDPVGAIPSTVSSLPDGIYRASISADEVAAAGHSNASGLSGTWTLTVRHGTYEVRCRPLTVSSKDCGEAVYDGPLDVGDLRGDRHTAYFVYLPQRLAKLTGCKLPTSTFEHGHCASAAPYRATWVTDGANLTFSDFRGVGDTDELSIKPWRKIG